jgi:hypothetical protein
MFLLLLGSVLFVAVGSVKEHISGSMCDFKNVYYAGRCLLEHCDPYQRNELKSVYLTSGGDHPTPFLVEAVTTYVYLPTIFLITGPLALLPWGPAHLLWMAVTACAVIFAAILIWNPGAQYAPLITGCFIGFLLANSVWLLMVGNPAGIAVGLCVVAVWCFLQERFLHFGVLCLAISLVIKPHDSGLIWAYFLLAGKAYRKRALQTLALAFLLSLPGIVWISHVAPNWVHELNSNILAASARGGLSDPGPAGHVPDSANAVIDLQTAISVFWDDPEIYNPASYLLCGILLLLWGLATLRAPPSPSSAWLALAVVAPLSMLPVYHMQHDARLLLLTFPACASLWAKGGLLGWFALLMNAASVVLSGDIVSVLRIHLVRNLLATSSGFSQKVLTVLLGRPVPLALLGLGVLYLWVYMDRAFGWSGPTNARHGDFDHRQVRTIGET